MGNYSTFWSYQLFQIGGVEYTVGQFILLTLLLIFGFAISKFLEHLFSKRLAKTQLRPQVIQTLQRVFFYILIIGVISAALSLLHVPLTSFAFLTGAVAIGIGFGAQNIINNFISGWILMTEQPVRIGDFIEIDQFTGVVERVGNRSTRIRRTDGVHLLVPNSQMLERVVVNWTLIDNNIRTMVRIGVAYGSPIRRVTELFEKAVTAQPDILKEPSPRIIFEDFGDNALIFDAIFWCAVGGERELRQIRSNIRFMISEMFAKENITIAYPQRDVHIDGLELLDDWDANAGSWVWLNISGVADEFENTLLNERFGVPSLAIQDAHRERHPPKIEFFTNQIFIILRDLLSEDENRQRAVSQISLFLGANFLVTRHLHNVPAIESVVKAVQSQPDKLKAGPAHTLYLLSRRIVDNYTPVVLELEERLAELEDLDFEQPGDDVIELITRYNRSLKRLRRHLVYQRDVMVQLCRPAGALPIKLDVHEFNDVFENMERLASLCQLNQELAVDLLNTHFSLVSHRLNQVMRVLTITTVIFLPLALLAGIYGMNFAFIPELSWHYGYFGVLGAMVGIIIVLIAVFKRRGWL